MSEFAKGDVKKLREYIKNAVMQGDNSEILYKIGNDRIKPSKIACKTPLWECSKAAQSST